MNQSTLNTLYREALNPDRRYVLVVCIFSVILFIGYSLRYSTVLTHGFAAYYGYARLLLEGDFVPATFEYEYFNQQLREFGFGSVLDAPNNIPTNAFALLPFSFFSPPLAKFLWTVLSLVCYAVSIAILLRVNSISPSSVLGLGTIALACLWKPVLENMAYGQLYVVLLFFFCLSLQGIARQKDSHASIPLVFMVLLKGYGLLNALWLVVNKHFKAAIIFVLFFILTSLISFQLFGNDVWIAYYENVFISLTSLPPSGHIAYQTINSFLLHLLHFDPVWSPAPVLELSRNTVQVIIIIIQLFMLSFVLYAGSKTSAQHKFLSYSTIIAATVVTAPLAEQYHYVLFLPLTISMLGKLTASETQKVSMDVKTVFSFMAILLLAVPIPYKLLHSAAFPWYVLGYPKLIGGILLIALSSYVMLFSKNAVKRIES